MLIIRLTAIMLLCNAGCARSEPSPDTATAPPPVECREKLGAWCILALSARDVSVEYSMGDETFLWRITDPRWDGEEFSVREPASCRTTLASRVKMINHGVEIEDTGREYQRLTFSLRDDGKCDLEVKLENNRDFSFGWANAPAIIAPCFAMKDCSEGSVFRYIARDYNQLRKKEN
jgi:hypothetical protein